MDATNRRAGGNRHARRAAAKRGRQQVFQLTFYTPEALLHALLPGADMTVEAGAAMRAAVDVMAGGKLCACCDHEFARGEMPGSIMVARPFIARPGQQALCGGVCQRCEDRGASFVQEACIARFRADGVIHGAREIQAGAA